MILIVLLGIISVAAIMILIVLLDIYLSGSNHDTYSVTGHISQWQQS